MAKTWKLARYRTACGSEYGCWIQEHEPYLSLSGQGWLKVRCERHAGEPAPENIQPEPEKWLRPKVGDVGSIAGEPVGFTGLASMAKTLPFKRDWKLAQSGEGEE